jgi:repressor LexA
MLARRRENGAFGISVQVEEIPGDAMCEVALLGRVAAGAPLDVIHDAQTITVPRFMMGRVRPEQVYALRVTGDSMIDEHICDGDIALIENRTEARDGEIVVALVEGERATLKRLYRFGGEVELRPANSQIAPIRLPARQVVVQGIFRGLLRPAA